MVEGSDDKWAAINLLSANGVNWDSDTPKLPYVAVAGGIAELLDAISTAAKSFERLGIIVDADLSLTDRYAQVRSRLGAVGVILPDKPSTGGVIVDGYRSQWRVGIWLMPDNIQPGILEDFLAFLVSPGSTIWQHAQNATIEAMKLGASVASKDRSKAQIHTWLAWHDPPGLPFGTALTAKVLGSRSQQTDLFVDWFNRLYL